MIKKLIKLATHLDSKGLRKEADYLDAVIRKIAETKSEPCKEKQDDGTLRACIKGNYQVRKNDSWSRITEAFSPGRTMEENAALNIDKNTGEPMTTKTMIHPCDDLTIWTTSEYEGGANNPECYGDDYRMPDGK